MYRNVSILNQLSDIIKLITIDIVRFEAESFVMIISLKNGWSKK